MKETIHRFEGFNLPKEGFTFNLNTGAENNFYSDNFGIYYYYKNALVDFVRDGTKIFVPCSVIYSETKFCNSYNYYPRIQ